MEISDKERGHLVNIIVTGIRFYRINDIIYCVSYPSIEDIAYSEFLYSETIDKYKYNGWLTAEEHQNILIGQGLLDGEFREKLASIDNTIEEFKVKLYLTINPVEEEGIRKRIKIMRLNSAKISKPLDLISGRTLEDVASSVANNHLLKQSLYDGQMNKIYNISPDLLEKIIYKMNQNPFDHEKIRYLARTDPWKTHWSLSKPNPFSMSTVQWNSDQKVIVIYSKLYDSVADSLECPSEEVIADDDKLDGWLTLQRRQREKDRMESDKNSPMNKHADAQEVYIFAPNDATAKKIEGFNSPQSMRIKNNRNKQIKEQGVVKEGDLHDVRQGINMQQTKAFSQSVKGRK